MADNKHQSQGNSTPGNKTGTPTPKTKPATASTPASDEEPAGTKSAPTAPPTGGRKSTEKATRRSPRSSTKGLWLVVIIIFLLVLALAGAGYWYWQQQGAQRAQINAQLNEQQQTQLDRLNTVEQQNRELQQQLAQLEKSRQQLAGVVDQLSGKTQQIQRQSQQALAELNNIEGKRPSDWLLAEADYLVRMAGRKVWLEKDIRTATMLLQNADTRLSELADPSVIPVRELLAKDIQTLRQINPVSRTSVALAISGMLAQVDNLPLDTFEQPDGGQNSAVSDSIDDWQQNLKQVWRNIVDDFISVTRTDTPIKPVMSQQQQWLNREQLKLQLMQAQSAAVGAQQTLYEQSLQNALKQLINNYDIEDVAVKGFVDSVQNLLETDVSQQLPESLQSTQPLQHLLEQRVQGAFGQGDRAS